MNQELLDLMEEIEELTETKISLEDLAETIEKTPEETMGMISLLKNKGLNIVTLKADDGIHILNQGELDYKNDYKYKFSTGKDHKMKFLVISDTRFGSKFAQKTILNELYERAYKQGINHVIHTGNITEGLYKISNNMVDTLIEKDTLSQAKYVAKNYPYI